MVGFHPLTMPGYPETKGADLVEISPPLEGGGDVTAITGTHLYFEMLCLLADARAKRVGER